jgi:hypothetical protein
MRIYRIPSRDFLLVCGQYRPTHRWHHHIRWVPEVLEDGDSIFLRNVVIALRIYLALQPQNTSALIMDTTCYSETFVSTYESTRRHNAEERHSQRRENTPHNTAAIRDFSFLSRRKSGQYPRNSFLVALVV